MDSELKNTIRKYALDNARKYNGIPNMGSIIGKILSERSELKAELKSLTPEIKKICDEVRLMGVDEQVRELERIAPDLLIEKKIVEEKKLKPLPNIEKGKLVMRLAPSPSGPLHVGHAVVFSLSHLYCKEYDGRLILRIEDTNPENIYEPAYRMIEEDCNWFTENGIAKLVVQSDRLDTYYDYAEKLVNLGKAYVCTCSADVFRNFSMKKQACPCRELPLKEHLLRWDKMFVEYEPGQAVVRIKTDINDPNPAMRDWPALRINHSVHPKQGDKYKVWPLMNFSVAVDDHELGITHTIRGKDHVDNAKRQKHIFDFFKWTIPNHSYIGKINFEGLEISKTKVKKAIEYGHFTDWDDIRLPFLAALRRRGFQPGAFQKFAMDMGVGLNDKVVPAVDFFKSLEAHNRDIIDPISNRYFFVWNPVKISVKNAPEQSVSIPLHPDNKQKGKRVFKTKTDFFVPKDDLAKVKVGKLYRLMDCLNFTKKAKEFLFDSTDYAVFREKGAGTMHWIPAEADAVDVEVLMPDNKVKKGIGEPILRDLDVGTIVQLERFGFCRLDKKENNKIAFWFAHR
ncbi:MAG TPA: glutamate--tRNA ligase [Candidatus Nanoarchaeia archaeon]|nr:glutamate--tRNA ligase [Candidatus Nanoarchaeia archaeon]